MKFASFDGGEDGEHSVGLVEISNDLRCRADLSLERYHLTEIRYLFDIYRLTATCSVCRTLRSNWVAEKFP